MKKISFLTILFLLPGIISVAQEKSSYRYDNDFLSPEFYRNLRSEFREKMPPNSIAFLFSAPEKTRANDTNYPFHQNPNFFYLTGLPEPNSILVISKSAGTLAEEMLFVPMRNPEKEVWTGRLAGIHDAFVLTGIAQVYHSSSFDSMNFRLDLFDKILHLTIPADISDAKNDPYDLFNLVESFRNKISSVKSKSDDFILARILKEMREVKKEEEIVLMRKAINMSIEGHIEMMRALAPGFAEYQAEAVGEYVFKKLGAEDVGYNSICGGGENSCILHYETNRKPLKAGEMLLLDMGAEYHGYTADVTRTLPVNGKFSAEQRIIYNIVLAARDSALQQCRPGNKFKDPHDAAVKVIQKGLMDLGIISREEDYRKYFMHRTSHYLGLDVHDAGTFGDLKVGTIITVEPGIYISKNSPCDSKWWNIGIRIEDDVLLTATGHENLSEKCPVTIEEIEKVMMEEPIHIKTANLKLKKSNP